MNSPNDPVFGAAPSPANARPKFLHPAKPATRPPRTGLILPVRRSDLRADGSSDAKIRAQRHDGRLHTLRPGIYLPSEQARASTAHQRHRALIAGFVDELSDTSVISYFSAAVMYGMPLWNVAIKRVHVSREQNGGAHRSKWVHVHATTAALPVAHVEGFAVTSAARTVVDCLRLLPFEQGVILADDALHRALVTRDELEAEVTEARGRNGAKRAARVVQFADGLSESVGESRSRVVMRDMQLPPMQLQQHIVNSRGYTVGKVDFAIPELKIAGEFDGKVKYGRLVKPGETPGDAAFREKRREDAIRDAWWEVVRWIWDELNTPWVIFERWQRAIARATRER